MGCSKIILRYDYPDIAIRIISAEHNFIIHFLTIDSSMSSIGLSENRPFKEFKFEYFEFLFKQLNLIMWQVRNGLVPSHVYTVDWSKDPLRPYSTADHAPDALLYLNVLALALVGYCREARLKVLTNDMVDVRCIARVVVLGHFNAGALAFVFTHSSPPHATSFPQLSVPYCSHNPHCSTLTARGLCWE